MINNQIARGVSVRMCPEYENPHFSHIFFQPGYLTYYSTYLLENVYMYIPSMYMDGGVSQIVYIGFSFCFIVYRR